MSEQENKRSAGGSRLNTILLAVTLAVLGWNLKETVDGSKDIASIKARLDSKDDQLREVKASINRVEDQVRELQTQMMSLRVMRQNNGVTKQP